MDLKRDINHVGPHSIVDNSREEKEDTLSIPIPTCSTDGQQIYVFPDAGTFSAKTRPVPSKLSSQALWVTRDVSVTFTGRCRCTASLWGYTHHWPNLSYSHSTYPQRSGCQLRSRIHDEHKAPWIPPANLIPTLCGPLKFVEWRCSSLSIKSIIIFQSGASITLRNNVKYKNTGGNVLSFLNWNSHSFLDKNIHSKDQNIQAKHSFSCLI